jgi:RNA-binding protein
MPKPLTATQRKKARGLAHHLEPVVRVGHEGVTDGVVSAVRQALHDHELIKVRLYEPEDKKAMADALASATESSLCGLVGHTVILYRRHPEKPRFEL